MFSQTQNKKSSSRSIFKVLSDGINVNLGSLGEFSVRLSNLQHNLLKSLVWLMSHGVAVAYEDHNDEVERKRWVNDFTEIYFKANETNYGLNVIDDYPCVMNAMVSENCEIMRNVSTKAISFETLFSWDDGFFAKLGRGEDIYSTDKTDDFYIKRDQIEQCLKGLIDECYLIYEAEQKKTNKEAWIMIGLSMVGTVVGMALLFGCMTWSFRRNDITPAINEERQPLTINSSENPATLNVVVIESKDKPEETIATKLSFQERLERLRNAGFIDEIPDHFFDLATREIINEPQVSRDGFTLDKQTVNQIITCVGPKKAKCLIDRSKPLLPTYPNFFATKTIENYLTDLEKKYFSEKNNEEQSEDCLSFKTNLLTV